MHLLRPSVRIDERLNYLHDFFNYAGSSFAVKSRAEYRHRNERE